MKRLTKTVLVALSFSLVAIALSFFHARPAAAVDSKPVTVENTPLPVSGTVNVSNLPSSQIVSFNGTAQPVSISNTASTPLVVRDVDRPTRHPFALHLSCNPLDGIGCNSAIPDPANQEFVIETVSVQATLPTGQRASVELGYWIGGDKDLLYLPLELQGTFSGDDHFANTISARAYAEPGANVSLNATRNSNSGTAHFYMAVSGYLVDCGAGAGCPLP
jgi:hypothetical protein